MTGDLPPGPWSDLLIGHHWPADSSLSVLRAALVLREGNRAAHDSYADRLESIARATLAEQDGLAADGARARFDAGQRHARDIAERNAVKLNSYRSAIATTESLRQELTAIADRGNRAIEEIRSSPAPPSEKISAITDVIAEAHSEAAARSALHAGSVYCAMQTIVDAESLGPSARAFAASHGLAVTDASAPHADAVRQRVTAAVHAPGGQ